MCASYPLKLIKVFRDQAMDGMEVVLVIANVVKFIQFSAKRVRERLNTSD